MTDVESDVSQAVQAAETEGLAAEAKVEATVQETKGFVTGAIARLEAEIQTLEARVEDFTTHEKAAVEQYLLALKTRVHALLLKLNL